MIGEQITLGIGTPSTLFGFLTFGLHAGVAVDLDPALPRTLTGLTAGRTLVRLQPGRAVVRLQPARTLEYEG